jgi:hypothetical protein
MDMNSSSFITIDDSQWPLLVVEFVGEPTLQQQDQYFSRTLTYLRRGEKFFSILDARRVRMMTADHRRNVAAFQLEHEALLRSQVLGCASIIDSPVMQLASSIIQFFKPPPYPHVTTRTLPEAASWVAAQMDSKGLYLIAERIRCHYLPHLRHHVD